MRYLACICLLSLLCICACQKASEDKLTMYYNQQKELLKSSQIIVCYPSKDEMFDSYAGWDTKMSCITNQHQGALVTLQEIYSWGFKLIQIVNCPDGKDPKKNDHPPLYYFDKR